MKSVNCKLICWTSRGYECFSTQCPSIKRARELGKQMVDDGFAFSYNIYRIKENEKCEN